MLRCAGWPDPEAVLDWFEDRGRHPQYDIIDVLLGRGKKR